MLTVIVTTFNRADIVGVSVRSALEFVHRIGGNIVLVDDGSSDQTFAQVRREFGGEIADQSLQCISHPINRGTTAAKNTGFQHSRGDWVIFLDSDDTLIADSAEPMQKVLNQQTKTPVVFFRCVDHNGDFVGLPFDDVQELSLRRYGQFSSYGEALVAMNKTLVQSAPFDDDLLGYEGLGCARMIKKFGPALLSPIVARIYNRSRTDRLSTPLGMLRRAELLARGHLRFVELLGDSLTFNQRFNLRAKAALYYGVGTLFRMIWRR